MLLGAWLTARPLHGQEAERVWANPRSGVYHCPGTPAYGTTQRGEYLDEAEARRRGYRANGGRTCAVVRPQGLMGQAGTDTNYVLPDASPAAPTDSLVPCVVSSVTDGDTFRCQDQGPVRLIGIDAPEQQQPHGPAATAALVAMLPRGTTVYLERDVQPRDRYQRLLAYVWHQGVQINWRLVREGWARSVRYAPTIRHQLALDEAHRRARRESRGLWNRGAFQ